MKALDADTGISNTVVSRICANLDEDVAAFRDRPLTETTYPYVFLDATYCKARVGRRVVSQAVVVAVGVAADGVVAVGSSRSANGKYLGVRDSSAAAAAAIDQVDPAIYAYAEPWGGPDMPGSVIGIFAMSGMQCDFAPAGSGTGPT